MPVQRYAGGLVHQSVHDQFGAWCILAQAGDAITGSQRAIACTVVLALIDFLQLQGLHAAVIETDDIGWEAIARQESPVS
ncbi:hypothetical protein D9M68_895820 [compost metagenome]